MKVEEAAAAEGGCTGGSLDSSRTSVVGSETEQQETRNVAGKPAIGHWLVAEAATGGDGLSGLGATGSNLEIWQPAVQQQSSKNR